MYYLKNILIFYCTDKKQALPKYISHCEALNELILKIKNIEYTNT